MLEIRDGCQDAVPGYRQASAGQRQSRLGRLMLRIQAERRRLESDEDGVGGLSRDVNKVSLANFRLTSRHQTS